MAYVMMAIPAELVPAVTDFIEGQGSSSSLQGTPTTDGFANGWDAATVRRAYLDSANKMRRLLTYLAEHPDEELSSEQIADGIDARYGWNTVAGMLGAFGRRSANHYAKPEPMWWYRWNDDGHILLTMPRAAAMVIKNIAGT